MIFFKPYSSIKGFLERFTLIKIGKLHIRIHSILEKDQTTLFHTHPFHYISIVLKGGYVDSYIGEDGVIRNKTYKQFSIIVRKASTYHRIHELFADTKTLFIAFGNYGWDAVNLNPSKDEDGIFVRLVNGRMVFSKKKLGIWYIGSGDRDIAIKETRHSIYQKILPL